MTASTDLDDTLANIRARAEAATPGPWRVDEIARVWADRDPAGWDAFHIAACHDSVGRACDDDEANAEFIAHARADVPRLLDLLDEQRDVIARVQALASEWAHQPTDYDEDTEQQIADGHALLAALDGADTTTTDGSEA
ncbi:ead/Ea22-like family protein [Pimelobacter simplex]|nr:ead/Ea22-like family protein [Pimelobacter simplex]